MRPAEQAKAVSHRPLPERCDEQGRRQRPDPACAWRAPIIWATRQIADSSLSDEVGARRACRTILGCPAGGLGRPDHAARAARWRRPRPAPRRPTPEDADAPLAARARPSRHRRRLRRRWRRLSATPPALALADRGGRRSTRAWRRPGASPRSRPAAPSLFWLLFVQLLGVEQPPSSAVLKRRWTISRSALTLLVDHARSCRRRLAGLVWGILGGALPGISASITMALLLPFTYTHGPGVGDRPARLRPISAPNTAARSRRS